MTNRHIIELIGAIGVVLALGACASMCQKEAPPPPKTVDTGCNWNKPFPVSVNDTLETRKHALAAYKAYDENCVQLKGEALK
jgi:hypothetical protein